MKVYTKVLQVLAVAGLVTGFSLTTSAQAPGAPQAQPDEVDQLAQVLGLTDEQQIEIRSVIDDISPEIQKLQAEAQSVQQELREQAGPDFDEAEIRETAAKLGDITGEMTALTVILQSKVQQVFTEDQRQELEDLERQQQQQQQQQPEQPQSPEPGQQP